MSILVSLGLTAGVLVLLAGVIFVILTVKGVKSIHNAIARGNTFEDIEQEDANVSVSLNQIYAENDIDLGSVDQAYYEQALNSEDNGFFASIHTDADKVIPEYNEYNNKLKTGLAEHDIKVKSLEDTILKEILTSKKNSKGTGYKES